MSQPPESQSHGYISTIMHDDVSVVEDGHRCCVMTIMLDDVHVAEDG